MAFKQIDGILNLSTELLISSTGIATEYKGNYLGLYELQEEMYKNHSVYKLKHTTGVEDTKYLFT